MGSVYDVEDVTVEKRYVLKTLHPSLVDREDLARRMRDEARSLARLQHPNIVDVVTAGVTNDERKMPFYVMERLVGQNLRVVLDKTGALQITHAFRIAIDVADALEHAHESSIVHRDVKPENIFLHRNANGTTTTKLLDFGIVRMLDRKASQTQGKFIGTLRYASPEQITGAELGPATDIYSLGVVLFEMLCGRGPFDEAGDAYAVGAAHAGTPAPPLSRFVRGVAPELERLVASALSKRPDERPADCFAFASELRRLLREEQATPTSATAVNLVTSGPPPTGAPTLDEVLPSVMVEATIADPASARVEDDAPVSPIAPTIAAEGMSPVVAPAPVTPVLERPIDRDAATRTSAPLPGIGVRGGNDTQAEVTADVAPSVVVDVPVPVPRRAADVPTVPRRADRTPVLLIVGATVLAIAMVAGALLAVRRPAAPARASAEPAATASPPAGSAVVVPAVTAPPSAPAPATAPAPEPPPTPKATRPAQPAGPAKPRPAAGPAKSSAKEVPFDP